ncbi:hydrolase [Pseudoalteromonas piscicida]|uniref:Hydrolase n=1 Tax=Pseudoalteromonas piscicida TaxID=43662 RepID=A0AAQ2ETH5_PSEO7|nr:MULTISPECIES: MBL fold metallo-hydrolase [Pseudoalteromonas]KJY89621.1 hydrolase [Pseudoalteromonas piscicida]TMN37224.1 hydrolase [Pseudoalteromonas piscicida]TMN43803.1 hydrolase [Pseudoalteromonas piscicida]TMN56717.1 hydrolase [Pseudoalteromonas piscicida]TMN57748.1 hydrolase [Pseudoalteromonas piscicida]
MASNLNATVNQSGYSSTQYSDGKFHNTHETNKTSLAKTLEIFWRFFTEQKVNAVPKVDMPVKVLTAANLKALSDTQTHVIKLGHSSVLIKAQGQYLLIDPVFAERASPFSFIGPKRFHQPPITIESLPQIDKVLISHNHYDHLDKESVKRLADRVGAFYVPLGVEGDLQKWGVPAEKIKQFDWWQFEETAELTLTFTPTQHFSGRGLGDANKTLWGAWAIRTADKNIFFSGDSGYFAGFKEIGERLGPFDLTLVETGAYDKDWSDIHMTPEQSVQAHIDLRGTHMIPIHNATFDLAFHSWFDPLVRVKVAAEQNQVALVTPVVGEVLTLSETLSTSSWWEALMP